MAFPDRSSGQDASGQSLINLPIGRHPGKNSALTCQRLLERDGQDVDLTLAKAGHREDWPPALFRGQNRRFADPEVILHSGRNRNRNLLIRQ